MTDREEIDLLRREVADLRERIARLEHAKAPPIDAGRISGRHPLATDHQRLTASERSRLRKSLTSHKYWREYREALGLKIDSMTPPQLLGAANHLGIDVSPLLMFPVRSGA